MIIYLARNTINGKCYVGQTKRSVRHRIKDHKSVALTSMAIYSYLHKAIRKHGWENFTWEVLEETDEAGLDMAERFWIRCYNSLSPNGYNLDSGGHRQKVRSAETRAKIGAAHRGRSLPLEQRKKLSQSAIGRKHTPEARARMSVSQRGRTHSEETKRKIGAASKGKRKGKLDWAKVSSIRKLSADGILQKEIAAQFEIDQSQISMIVRNKCWPEEDRPCE